MATWMRLSLLIIGLMGVAADFYSDLGLGEEATDSEIKKAFRTMSRKLHPDHNPSPEAKDQYATIQKAYGVLSDRKKKKVYDMMGEDGLKELENDNNGRGGGGGVMDMFFGGGFGGQESTRGPETFMSIRIRLDDIYNGETHTVTITKQKLKSKQVVKDCMTCKAKPAQMKKVQIAPGFYVNQQMPPSCGHVCKGGPKQLIKDHKQNLDVFIEQGVPEGHELRYDMEGDEFPDKLPGDIIFVVNSAPHKFFERDGDNLEMVMKISLVEALVGFEKTITHMDGHEVAIKQTVVTSHGTVKRLKGEGMPKHNVPSEKGDLLITFEVDFPKHLTEDQKKQVQEILA